MKTRFLQAKDTLENRIFKSSIYLGFTGALLLIIYDVFFTGDYHSVVTEVFGILFFGTNYYFIRKRNASNKYRLIFSLILLIIIDYAWITGGGISVLLAVNLFIAIQIILAINDSKYYRTIFIILLANYFMLFSLEYFWQFNLASDFLVYKHDLVDQFIIWFFLYFFSGLLTLFLKVNYNKEHANLNKANEELKNKSAEITAQNEELKASQQNLDRTNSILNQQRRELIDIKGSLEDTVRERTNDLLSLNKRLLFQNQQLEQYAYITSHNLRAPIAHIKGLVHLLPHDNEFDGKTKETLNRLAKSTTGMEKVFADLSMILNVKNSLQNPWKDVDIIHEISEVVQALNSSIIEKNIQIDVPSYQSFVIKAQRPYVYSIFHNLVENAIKYADGNKTKPFIKIVLSETEKYVKISISDNGIGIDMEAASGKVFQMYQRFNNTHPGQGFGLFLVKSQMEAMRGKVELESILGQGSTFNLYFSKN